MLTQTDLNILKEWHGSVVEVIVGCDPMKTFPERYAPGWALGDFIEPEPINRRLPTMLQTAQIVCEECDMDYIKMMGRQQKAEIVCARQIGMALMYRQLDKTISEIGRFYGKDPTSVSHALSKIDGKRLGNASLEMAYQRCLARMRARPVEKLTGQ